MDKLWWTSKAQRSLYSGQWTPAEEEYAECLIKDFRDGALSIPKGTSLRGYLAKELECSPKRISKKFENTGYNGKQQYGGKATSTLTAEQLEVRSRELQRLKEDFQTSRMDLVAQKTKGKAKAASLAAAAVAGSAQEAAAASFLGVDALGGLGAGAATAADPFMAARMQMAQDDPVARAIMARRLALAQAQADAAALQRWNLLNGGGSAAELQAASLGLSATAPSQLDQLAGLRVARLREAGLAGDHFSGLAPSTYGGAAEARLGMSPDMLLGRGTLSHAELMRQNAFASGGDQTADLMRQSAFAPHLGAGAGSSLEMESPESLAERRNALLQLTAATAPASNRTTTDPKASVRPESQATQTAESLWMAGQKFQNDLHSRRMELLEEMEKKKPLTDSFSTTSTATPTAAAGGSNKRPMAYAPPGVYVESDYQGAGPVEAERAVKKAKAA